MSRLMMPHFSASVKTPPRATKRRMSRPDAGLAMIPTTCSRVEEIFAEPSLANLHQAPQKSDASQFSLSPGRHSRNCISVFVARLRTMFHQAALGSVLFLHRQRTLGAPFKPAF